MDLDNFQTWIFDCDGVLLDSNRAKSDGFYHIAKLYGEEPAKELLRYHKENGGIPRQDKFRYFFSDILKLNSYEDQYQKSLEAFGKYCSEVLSSCPTTKQCEGLLEKVSKPKFILTGGSQKEIREVFDKRGLSKYFTKIYGNPDKKLDILKREIEGGNIELPAVFFGDSRYDYEAAEACGCSFVFVYGYTEFQDWEAYFSEKKILGAIRDLSEL